MQAMDEVGGFCIIYETIINKCIKIDHNSIVNS